MAVQYPDDLQESRLGRPIEHPNFRPWGRAKRLLHLSGLRYGACHNLIFPHRGRTAQGQRHGTVGRVRLSRVTRIVASNGRRLGLRTAFSPCSVSAPIDIPHAYCYRDIAGMRLEEQRFIG
jgi:hypothetical protein